MATVVDILEQSCARFGPQPALVAVDKDGRNSLSYAELWELAGKCAALLRAHGVDRGDRVAIWGANSPAWVLAFVGILRLGAVVVPLDAIGSPEFATEIFGRVEARLLLADAARLARWPATAGAALSLDTLVKHLRDLAVEESLPSLGADDLAEVVFTSGSTGAPKGVMLTHGNLASNVRAIAAVLPPLATDRLVSILPLSHVLEQVTGLLLPLSGGGAVVYPASRASGDVFAALRRHRVTALVLVPHALKLFMDAIEREVSRQGRARQWRLSQRIAPWLPQAARRWLFRSLHQRLGGRLRLISVGGAPLDPGQAERWERLGIPIVQGYGMTEAAPAVAGTGIRDRRLGSVGRALPGQRVRLAPDGEILAAGPNIMAGYWRDPEGTRLVLQDGWYATGDLGRLDKDGYLYLLGRKKDMIVLASGLNVHAEDVERALLAEPGVRAAAVLDVPKASGEPQVHAVLVGPASEAEAAAAIKRANTRLLPFQRVQAWTLWPEPELPQTTTLKVKKHELRARLQQGLAPGRPGGAAPAAAGALVQLISQVAQVSPDRVTPGARLGDDLGLDSLGRVELLVALEAELGLALDEQHVGSDTTISELEGLASEAPPPPPAPLARWPREGWSVALRAGIQRALLFPLLRLVVRIDYQGVDHLTGLHGPVLLTPNHTSHLDSLTVLSVLPADLRRHVAVAAAADYFFTRGWLGAAVSLVLNAFPFARTGAIRATLTMCHDLTQARWSILLYPEGTRSQSGSVGAFRGGVGLLAIELGVPVVPVRLRGLDVVLPKGRRWPRPGRASVRFGPPLSFDHGTSAQAATEAIERAVRAL